MSMSLRPRKKRTLPATKPTWCGGVLALGLVEEATKQVAWWGDFS